MKNDVKLLKLMLADQCKQSNLYFPGEYWNEYCLRTSKAIIQDGLQDFRSSTRIGKGYADTVWLDPADNLATGSLKALANNLLRKLPFYKRFMISPYIDTIKWHFDQTQIYKDMYYTKHLKEWLNTFSSKFKSLPNTLLESPLNTISIDNTIIGKCYLDAFIRIDNYSAVTNFPNIRSMLEIGGGFGALTHSISHFYPNIRKFVYLDIPPIIYVGTQYLKSLFNDSVKDYTETRDSSSINFSANDDLEIFAICPWQIEDLQSNIDLIWSSASFQEMSKDAVANYAYHINRIVNTLPNNICVYLHNKARSGLQLSPSNVLELISERTSITFDQLFPKIEIEDSFYFVGQKINHSN